MNSYQQQDNQIHLIKDSLEVVGGLFSNYNLDKIKIRPRSTLFEKSAKEKAELLKAKRCIECCRKLKIDRKGNGRCGSKYKCKVFIRAEVLKKYA